MKTRTVWLRASYHMATPYSIRTAPSSPFAGRSLPTPGPATVQLAMIRTSIELFGLEVTRRLLFPSIVASEPLTQPPMQVAMSDQLSKMLKARDDVELELGLGYRESCHADGQTRVFIRVPLRQSEMFREIAKGIGYWGQGHGFACCTEVLETEPVQGTYAVASDSITPDQQLRSFFTAFVTEFTGTDVKWSEVISDDYSTQFHHLRLRLYVWPLVAYGYRGPGQLWRFHSLV